jgi:vacuolar-type H+-ATPase subunit E/Vma4
MGYETLIQDLIQNAQSKSEEVIHRARKEAEQIASGANQEADQVEREFREMLANELDQKRRRRMNHTRIQIRSILLQARVSLIEEVLTRLKDLLRNLSETDDYAHHIKRFYEEILPELPEGGLTIRADKKGISTLTPLVKDRTVKFEMLPEEEIGGIEILSETGDLRILNTFNARLAKAQPQLLVEINKQILNHE